jgi:hypothetical protein
MPAHELARPDASLVEQPIHFILHRGSKRRTLIEAVLQGDDVLRPLRRVSLVGTPRHFAKATHFSEGASEVSDSLLP